jgi:hypothetical protein
MSTPDEVLRGIGGDGGAIDRTLARPMFDTADE